MNVEIYKIDVDSDFQGLSIAIREYEEINGTKYYSDIKRKAFRKYDVNSSGDTVLNNSFSEEIDKFTGIENFLLTKFNF